MLDALKSELAALQEFLQLLQREQAALSAADVDTLLTLTDGKLKLADQLNQLAHQRITRLIQAGFTGDSAGMNAWLAQQPEAVRAKASPLWDRLLESARNAKQINQTNGKLIAIHLQHNQQALNALTHAANQASVYGPDGQPRMVSSGRTLGKA